MSKKLLLLFFSFVLMLILTSACSVLVTTETPTSNIISSTATLSPETPQPEETNILEEIVVERTPLPTALPGPIQQEVERAVTQAGLARTQILGLRITDWIDLFLSVIYIILGYLVGSFLVKSIFRQLSHQLPEGLDPTLLKRMRNDLRLLFLVIIAFLTTRRLSFLSALIKTLLVDFYFIFGIFLAYRFTALLIRLVEDWYHRKTIEENQEEELAPVITLLVRSSKLIISIILITIALSHFGINVTAIAAAFGIGGLAISLAARDTIADAIAGFIILVDRPFRIGDRIEIQEVGTWGDVMDIGLRTTRIRTRDNRMVIVPNSMIGSNQVINYSYPDPQYRIETHIGIGYGTNIEKARKLMVDTVSKLDVVLKDKPIDALYIEMGDSAMIFRVRWWIESFADTRRVVDQVHTALQNALDKAGIECPYPTQSINLQVNQQTAEWFSHSRRDDR